MGDHAGYQWNIEELNGAWGWAVRRRGDDAPFLTGAADSRAHAAACVVRSLIQGTSSPQQPRSLAA